MKIKTSELSGAALDWAVGKAEGRTLQRNPMGPTGGHGWWIWEETPSGQGGIILSKSVYLSIGKQWSPSTNWAQGGPIIEREYIDLVPGRAQWFSHGVMPMYAPAPLIAAMRCFVADKMGYDVEVPDELCN
jgi:hypothetical protein